MKKTIFGSLLLIFLVATLVIILPGSDVRLDVGKTKTVFKQLVDDKWTISSTERVWFMDGTTKMRAKSRELLVANDSRYVNYTRVSNWKDNITMIQTYSFDNQKTAVEDFPVTQNVRVINAKGKILLYEIRDFDYEGETKSISSTFHYGNKMALTWSGSYYAKVFNQKSGDKIIIKFKPESDDVTYNIRMFDPVNLSDFQNAWILNETTSSVIKDWGTQKNNLTITGTPVFTDEQCPTGYSKCSFFDGSSIRYESQLVSYVDKKNYTTFYVVNPTINEDTYQRFIGDDSAMGELEDDGTQLKIGGRSGGGNYYYQSVIPDYTTSLNSTWYTLGQTCYVDPSSGNYECAHYNDTTNKGNLTWNYGTMYSEDAFLIGGGASSFAGMYGAVAIIYNRLLSDDEISTLVDYLNSGNLTFITGETQSTEPSVFKGRLIFANETTDTVYSKYWNGSTFSDLETYDMVSGSSKSVRFIEASSSHNDTVFFTASNSAPNSDIFLMNMTSGDIIKNQSAAQNLGTAASLAIGTINFNGTNDAVVIYDETITGNDKVFKYVTTDSSSVSSAGSITFNSSSDIQSRLFKIIDYNETHFSTSFYGNENSIHFLLINKSDFSVLQDYNFTEDVTSYEFSSSAITSNGDYAFVFGFDKGSVYNITFYVINISAGTSIGPFYVEEDLGYAIGNIEVCTIPTVDNKVSLIGYDQFNQVKAMVVNYDGTTESGSPAKESTTGSKRGIDCFSDYTNNAVVFIYADSDNSSKVINYNANGTWSATTMGGGDSVQLTLNKTKTLKFASFPDGNGAAIISADEGYNLYFGAYYDVSTETIDISKNTLVGKGISGVEYRSYDFGFEKDVINGTEPTPPTPAVNASDLVLNLSFDNSSDYLKDYAYLDHSFTVSGDAAGVIYDGCKWYGCLNLSTNGGDWITTNVKWNSTCTAQSFWVKYSVEPEGGNGNNMIIFETDIKGSSDRQLQNSGYGYSTKLYAENGIVNDNVGSWKGTVDTWEHVFIQYNNDTQVYSLWIDGVLKRNGSEPYGNLNNTYGKEMRIGAGEVGIDLQGYLDEFKIWNRCNFTQDDVTAEYELYKDGTPPELDIYVSNTSYLIPRNWTDDGGHNEPLLNTDFELNITIKNEGTNDSDWFYVSVEWDNGTVISDGYLQLDSGDSTTAGYNISVDSYKWRKITVNLDVDDEIAEDEEDNNAYVINLPFMDNFWTFGNNRTSMADALVYSSSSGDVAQSCYDWYKGFLSSNFSTSYSCNDVDPRGKKYLENAISCLIHNYTDDEPAKPHCAYAFAHMKGWAEMEPSTCDNVQSTHEFLWVEQANDIMFRNLSKADFQYYMGKYQDICQAMSTLSNTRPDLAPGLDDTYISGGNGWGFGSGIGSICDLTVGNVASNSNNDLLLDQQYWSYNVNAYWQNRVRSYLRGYGNKTEANYQEGMSYKWYSQNKIIPVIVGLNKAGISGFDEFNNAYCSMAKETLYGMFDINHNGRDLYNDEEHNWSVISRGDTWSYADVSSDTENKWDIVTYYGLLCDDQDVKNAIRYLRDFAYDTGNGRGGIPGVYNYYLLKEETSVVSDIEDYQKYFFDEQNDIATWRSNYTYRTDSVIQVDGGQHKMGGHPDAQGRMHYYNGYSFLANIQVPYNDNVRTEVWINGVSFSNNTAISGYTETCGGHILNQYYGDSACPLIGQYPDYSYLPLNMSGDLYNNWGSDDGLYGGVLNTIPMYGSDEPIEEHYIVMNGNVVRYVKVPYSDSGLILDQVLNRDTDINVSASSTSGVLFQAFDSETYLNFSIDWSNETGTMYVTNSTVQYGYKKKVPPNGLGYYRRTYYQIDKPSAEWISTEIGYTSTIPSKTSIVDGNDRGVNIDGQKAIFDTGNDGISYDGYVTDGWGLVIINSSKIGVNNATSVTVDGTSISLPESPYSGELNVGDVLSVSNVEITSSLGTNTSDENLSVSYSGSGYSNSVIDWRKYTPLTDGLVLWMPFNGSADDYSGEDNDGTVHGATLGSDTPGNWLNGSYDFDGDGDYIESTSLGLQEFTLTILFKSNPSSSVLIADGDAPSNGWNFLFSGTSCRFQTKNGTGTIVELYSSDVCVDGNWHQAAITINSTRGTKMYLDGVYQNESVGTQDIDYTGSRLRIGDWYTGTWVPDFNGSIAEPKIWNRSLSADEILDEYNRVKGGSSLAVLNMPFSLNSSTTAKDYSTATTDGTVTSATWSSERNGSYEFDGDGDGIYINDGVDNTYSSLTVNLWVYKNNNNTMDFIKQNSMFRIINSAVNIKACTINSSFVYGEVCLSEPITDLEWHMITYAVSNNIGAKLYVDGILTTTNTDPRYYDFEKNSDNFMLGTAGGYEWCNGSIDDVLIFDYALSPEQIAKLYNDGSMKTLVSEETSVGDVYTVNVTLSDYTSEVSSSSDIFTVLDSASCTLTSTQTISSDLDCSGESLYISGNSIVTVNSGVNVYCALLAVESGSTFANAGSLYIK